ncbi:MAG: DUF58 domain-containing protein [Chloroflexota bacterium]
MPKVTGRFYTFIIVAFLLYLAANQTQVNWLYVTSALIAGVVPTAFFLNRGALHNITGERVIDDGDPYQEFHEADEVDIALTIKAAKRRAGVHLDVTEASPLASPDDDNRSVSVFVPMLPAGNEVTINYTQTIDRRGLHTFPPVQMKTRAPFGLFQRSGEIDVPTSVLVYPEVRKLTALDFLDRQPAAQITSQRAGLGNEVIGVRPYRPGDSPRHIHWRSVARTGRLVSKEFAEETQPGVSIVIDRYMPPDVAHHPKHNPFELGIKAAVSIAEYALRQRYPVYIHADDSEFSVPYGAVTWDALMQYTARVPQAAEPTFTDLIEAGGFRQYVVVVVAHADEALLTPLIGLKYGGANVLAVVPDASTFPAGQPRSNLVDALHAEHIPAVELTYSEDWATQIADYRMVMST